MMWTSIVPILLIIFPVKFSNVRASSPDEFMGDMNGYRSACKKLGWEPKQGTFISNSSKSVKTKRCPDGYTRFEESCYLLNNEVSSWIEAYQICNIFDSRLVEVDSSEENTFIQGYLNEHGQQKGRMITTFTYRGNYGSREIEYRSFPGYWIGGQSMELPGHWYWGKSMKKVDFSILGSHAVDITDSSCLFLDRANLYQAGNKPCYTVMYSVCEKAPYTV